MEISPESGYIPNYCHSCGSADALNLELQNLWMPADYLQLLQLVFCHVHHNSWVLHKLEVTNQDSKICPEWPKMQRGSQRIRGCWSGDVLEFQVEHVLPSLWTPEIPESGCIPNYCHLCGSADALNLELQNLWMPADYLQLLQLCSVMFTTILESYCTNWKWKIKILKFVQNGQKCKGLVKGSGDAGLVMCLLSAGRSKNEKTRVT